MYTYDMDTIAIAQEDWTFYFTNGMFALLLGFAAYLLFVACVEPRTKRGQRKEMARREFAAVIRLGGTREDAMRVYKKVLRGGSGEEGWKEIGRWE